METTPEQKLEEENTLLDLLNARAINGSSGVSNIRNIEKASEQQMVVDELRDGIKEKTNEIISLI